MNWISHQLYNRHHVNQEHQEAHLGVQHLPSSILQRPSCTLGTLLGLLMYMMSVVDLVGNAVHQSVLPDVHDGICSTPAAEYSTPNEGLDAHDGCCRLGVECSAPKSAS